MSVCDGAYYTLLGVSNDASSAEIKRAFRHRALAVHPDRNKSADAVAAFQKLRHVHDVLLDPRKREAYDTRGEKAVDGASDDIDAAFWERASAQLSPDDIAAYEKRYPRSDDEKEDLAEFYKRFEGRVEKVRDFIPFAEDNTVLVRFIEVWDALIEARELEATSGYKKCRKRVLTKGLNAKRAEENKEKSRAVKEKQSEGGQNARKGSSSKSKRANPAGSSADDLIAAIQGRASQRAKDFDAWAESVSAREEPTREEPPAGGSKKKRRKAK